MGLVRNLNRCCISFLLDREKVHFCEPASRFCLCSLASPVFLNIFFYSNAAEIKVQLNHAGLESFSASIASMNLEQNLSCYF